jgi:hypothetical protein
MRNFTTRNQPIFSKSTNWLFSFLLGLGLTASLGVSVNAQSETAPPPPEIQGIIDQLQKAANQKNLDSVMQLFSPNFSHDDGLDYTTLSESLTSLWANFSEINYNTKLESWQREGDTIITETVTTIDGIKDQNGKTFNLNSTIRSRQHIQGAKITRQEILSERTLLKSGDNPPTVMIKLPEKVKVGQKFGFDVIVQEPLGDDLLLGAAIEESTTQSNYLNPATFELELLPAGGIFKLATAPSTPESRRLSAILIRSDGMIVVTQRLRVEK